MHFVGRLRSGRLGQFLILLLMFVIVASWASMVMARAVKVKSQ